MNQSRKKPASEFLAKGLGILLILALCLALVPQGSVQAAACKFRHKVQPGDTLIGLGLLYQIDWREIADANDLQEPYVLTVGEKLCIPGGTKPDTTTVTTENGETKVVKKEPVGTVVGGLDNVYVKLENFPKNTVYYVKVQPRSHPVAYRIARIRTSDTGFFEDYLKIPWYVPNAPQMLLCLKNAWTDEAACVEFTDPYFEAYKSVWTCNKLGR